MPNPKIGDSSTFSDLIGQIKTRLNDYQTKNLSTPIVVAGESKDTVESALSAINDNEPDLKVTDMISTSQNGISSLYGNNIWVDGDNIYYSNGSTQKILNKTTMEQESKTQTGLTNFSAGTELWMDGDHVYYSNQNTQYELDKDTSTQSTKIWGTIDPGNAYKIWNDGDNIYYSNGSTQYVLDRSTSDQSVKTWTGLTNFSGEYVWTDGDNIYYSNGSAQYVLDKSTSTQSVKTQYGIDNFYGNLVWTDGKDIYYSNNSSGSSSQYVLDKETNTWFSKYQLYTIIGNKIQTDGNNYYYSNGSGPTNQLKLVYYSIIDIIGKPGGLATLDANGKLDINQTNYVTAGQKLNSTIGDYATVEGYNNVASGLYAHAEGQNTTASGSQSHAEGSYTVSSSYSTHAEGGNTTANSSCAHSEGDRSFASGFQSHAEGQLTTAGYECSHVEGLNTSSSAAQQHVQGMYNAGNANNLFEIGNGIDNSNRHNGFEVDKDGFITIGDTKVSSIPSGAKWLNHPIAEYTFQIASTVGTVSHVDATNKWVQFIVNNEVKKEGAIPQIYNGITVTPTSYVADGTNDELIKVQICQTIYGDGIVVNGEVIDGNGNKLSEKASTNHTHDLATTVANGFMSSADKTKLDGVDPTAYMIKGTDYVTAGAASGSTIGTKATAEGEDVVASGEGAHAEGAASTAYGDLSHAEGYCTYANGENSHAEGGRTVARGIDSHAEGSETTAYGHGSHAEGFGTSAGYESQHVMGIFNDNKSTNLFEIGNGFDGPQGIIKRNAFEVDTYGNVVAAGGITLGNGDKLSKVVYSTTDLTPGSSALDTGALYIVYEA